MAGESKTTTDHQVIQEWSEQRGENLRLLEEQKMRAQAQGF